MGTDTEAALRKRGAMINGSNYRSPKCLRCRMGHCFTCSTFQSGKRNIDKQQRPKIVLKG